MTFSLSPFAPENLVSRDGLGRPVPRQPAYFPYSGCINLVLTRGIPLDFRGDVYLFTYIVIIYAVVNPVVVRGLLDAGQGKISRTSAKLQREHKKHKTGQQKQKKQNKKRKSLYMYPVQTRRGPLNKTDAWP